MLHSHWMNGIGRAKLLLSRKQVCLFLYDFNDFNAFNDFTDFNDL